ncbi:MAG: type II toxin-antitoxin system RelE/ParE family toxin [bacterium]
MQIKIELYVTEEGKVPFSEWLQSLKDRKTRAKIRVRLDHVRLGNLGNNKFLGNWIYELKIDYGPGYRIYYGQAGKKIILLLLGGEKKRQQSDIKQAQKYWADYRRRENEGN